MTLAFEVGDLLLRLTCRLVIVNICAEYFQNPLINVKVMNWTQNIPYNRPYASLTSKCYLDFGGRQLDIVVADEKQQQNQWFFMKNLHTGKAKKLSNYNLWCKFLI
jgi:hypothetical protein